MSERNPQRFADREPLRPNSSESGQPAGGASRTSRILTLASENEECDDFGAFGWLRGTKERAMMLELRKRNGNIIAIGYAWLERVEFDPSVGITLLVPVQRILIKGRNLNAEIRPNVRLFEGLTRHRVPWVQEVNEPAVAGSETPVVELIQLC